MNIANACDAKNSNQSTNAIKLGVILFILKPYPLHFSAATALPLDFRVPRKKGFSFPLLVDPEEVAALIFISNEGLRVTSREVREDLAKAS